MPRSHKKTHLNRLLLSFYLKCDQQTLQLLYENEKFEQPEGFKKDRNA